MFLVVFFSSFFAVERQVSCSMHQILKRREEIYFLKYFQHYFYLQCDMGRVFLFVFRLGWQSSVRLIKRPKGPVLLGENVGVLWSEWKEWGQLRISSNSPQQLQKYQMKAVNVFCVRTQTSLVWCWQHELHVWPCLICTYHCWCSRFPVHY